MAMPFTQLYRRLNIPVTSSLIFCALVWVLVFILQVFLVVVVSSPPRNQKKCFQQQCLRMLPPPLSSIKSGSSNLR